MQEAVPIRESMSPLAGSVRASGSPRKVASGAPIIRLGLVLIGALVISSWVAGFLVVAQDARRRVHADAQRNLKRAEVQIARKLSAATEELRRSAASLAASPELQSAIVGRQLEALQLTLAAGVNAGSWDLLVVTDYLGRVLGSAGAERPRVLTSPAVDASLSGAAAETFWALGGDLFQMRMAPMLQEGAVLGAVVLGRRVDAAFLQALRGGLEPHLVLFHDRRAHGATGDISAVRAGMEMEMGRDEEGRAVTLQLHARPAPAAVMADLPWPPLLLAAVATVLGSMLAGALTLRPHRDLLRVLSRSVRSMKEGETGAPVPVAGCRETRALGRALEGLRETERSRDLEVEMEAHRHQSALQLERRMREGAEERLSRAVTKIREQERMAELGQRAAEVAHEINNPAATLSTALAGIRNGVDELLGCLQRIADEPLPSADRRLFFAALEEAGRAAAEVGIGPPDEGEVSDLATQLVAAGCREPEAAARALIRSGLARWWHRLTPLVRRDEGPMLMEALQTHARMAVQLRSASTAASAVRHVGRSLKPRPAGDRNRPIDVRQGLEDAVALLEHEMRGRTRLTLDVGNLPRVRGEPGELCQVWTNLIHNAVQAMPGGGKLGVAARAEEDWVVIEVTDDGPGIAPEVRERIFESEVTTRAASGGSGLGLAIVRRIVEAHGGQISVESSPGHTRFQVRLPALATVAAGGSR